MEEIILIEKEIDNSLVFITKNACEATDESVPELKEPKKLDLDNMRPLDQEIAEIENFYKDCSLDEAIRRFSDKSNECFTVIRGAIFEVKTVIRRIKYIHRENTFKIESKILSPVVESFNNEIIVKDSVDDQRPRKRFLFQAQKISDKDQLE